MSNLGIFDRTIQSMQDRLNLNAARQQLVASNLANLDTPGYEAKELTFDQTLRESLGEPTLHLANTQDKSLDMDPTNLQTAMEDPKVTETGPVDMDWEMMKLTKNSIQYQFMIAMLNKKFSMLNEAIDGGTQ